MRVVITGAAGRIGREAVEALAGSCSLVLIDRAGLTGGEAFRADLSRPRLWWRRLPSLLLPRWTRALDGADVVLHLAAVSSNFAPWRTVLRHNVHATWNVLEAAARRQVGRVVFASSYWAVAAAVTELAPSCYRPDGPKLGSDLAPRPLRSYGISKAAGEICGRCMVDEGRLRSFLALRFGGFGFPAPPGSEDEYARWLGREDLRALLRRAVEAEFSGFHVAYGVSAQPESPFDLSHTRRLLSWTPQQLPRQRAS